MLFPLPRGRENLPVIPLFLQVTIQKNKTPGARMPRGFWRLQKITVKSSSQRRKFYLLLQNYKILDLLFARPYTP